MSADGLDLARTKMQEAGVAPTAVDVFSRFYQMLVDGETGTIPEAQVAPLEEVPHLREIDVADDVAGEAFAATVMIKLNGGLGTSMGMDRAKSLLAVRGEHTFLDVIARQVLAARAATGARLPLVLMNSFRTQEDTLRALAAYPDLPVEGIPLDFLQNREPKLRADDLTPVRWPADPGLEWCPPGHGDLYTALLASGTLHALLERGFRYASVSNADNLGAAPDARVAGWFATTGAPFAAEVARRTPADRKGGHLVVRRADGRIVLRESAQVPAEDAGAAGDIDTHRFFNTNNLWLDLQALAAELEATGGVLRLPLIRNDKTVDPSDPGSTPVVQIESAMGAAIEVFEGATVLEVDRSRFLPVKTTNDLLVLRSDVYRATEDHRLAAQVPAPLVDLDPAHYKTIRAFDQRVRHTPSLVGATALRVRGDWTFEQDVRVEGEARLEDPGAPATVGAGSTVTADGATRAAPVRG
ncbi:UTP--glucose-1-phosphate uridylyltransferase [Cellulomonas bogoriensis]|uniref:UTP--glucose-1-phosphate uridylyltransferase n=1 Tax=Cellulomonas bogoriensis 69B4 = DSM 16987 TaxID=1386082 RepID=A0A0A0BNS7_9CELL|nr:UTP--glucose-1-phosphate uridylyltransferase [Cellulomonas bogoriensis]KGM09600.1 UTP--glucose-1-phosphate uridylyltransferase [Cellulomonas bogoriensis 69B4 = DSM 16987]